MKAIKSGTISKYLFCFMIFISAFIYLDIFNEWDFLQKIQYTLFQCGINSQLFIMLMAFLTAVHALIYGDQAGGISAESSVKYFAFSAVLPMLAALAFLGKAYFDLMGIAKTQAIPTLQMINSKEMLLFFAVQLAVISWLAQIINRDKIPKIFLASYFLYAGFIAMIFDIDFTISTISSMEMLHYGLTLAYIPFVRGIACGIMTFGVIFCLNTVRGKLNFRRSAIQ